MKKISYYFLYILAALLGLSSCNKFLDVKPKDKFLSDNVYSSEITAQTAFNGIYLNIAKPALYGGNLTMTTVDVLAQYHNYVSSLLHQWSVFGNYNYTDASVQSTFTNIWNSAYRSVLNTNTFIEAMHHSGAIVPDGHKQLLLGEAHAMRAFLQFDMLRLFGPVYSRDSNLVSIPYTTVVSEKIGRSS